MSLGPVAIFLQVLFPEVTPPIISTLGGPNSTASAINNLGQVTGFSVMADNVTIHAFLWTP